MKMQWWKSLTGAVLAVSILLNSVPIPVLAEEKSWEDEEAWEEEGNTEFEQNTEVNQWEEIERRSEIIMRDPDLYGEIEDSDLKGAEVEHDQISRTYLMEDGTYLTRYFDDPIMYMDEEGNLSDIDNTLVAEENVYTNTENSYDLKLPKDGEGITIENKGYTLSLSPEFGTLDKSKPRPCYFSGRNGGTVHL